MTFVPLQNLLSSVCCFLFEAPDHLRLEQVPAYLSSGSESSLVVLAFLMNLEPQLVRSVLPLPPSHVSEMLVERRTARRIDRIDFLL